MRLSRALKEKLMDVRIRDKLVTDGKIKPEEVKKYLQSLPDETKYAYTEGEQERQRKSSR